MIVFTEEEIRKHVQIDKRVIDIVEKGFNKLASKEVELPPIMRVDIPENNGEVDVKTAYIKGYDHFAVKLSSGFFDNYRLGLPSGSGMMILLSTKTGVPEAILLDNGYLTDVRTAAAGAISAKYLAKENITTVGIIGAGSQAYYQTLALTKTRKFSKLLIYSRTTKRAEELSAKLKKHLDIEVIISNNAEKVIKKSDLVITTTPSTKPIIKKEWLHPGLHITAMGSDAEHKQELEAEVLTSTDLLVSDVKAQCFRLGELHHGIEKGILSKDSDIIELGEITSKQIIGRINDEQITVCDLTGTGVQDTAIALFAYEQLLMNGLGTKIGG